MTPLKGQGEQPLFDENQFPDLDLLLSDEEEDFPLWEEGEEDWEEELDFTLPTEVEELEAEPEPELEPESEPEKPEPEPESVPEKPEPEPESVPEKPEPELESPPQPEGEEGESISEEEGPDLSLEALFGVKPEARPEPEPEKPSVEEQLERPGEAGGRRVPRKPGAAQPSGAFREERKRVMKLTRRVQYCAFFGTLLLICLVGMLFFLRPKESALENRELTPFPSFTVGSFLSGEYTKGISTWYADTFPLRERIMTLENQFKGLYGLRGEQLIGSGSAGGGEEIPDEYVEEAEATAAPTTAAPLEEENWDDLEDGTIYDELEQVGDIYIAGNQGFGVYYFVQKNSDRFVQLMNQQYEQIQETSNLYVMLVPISAGVMLDQSVLDTLGASDEKAAIDYIYSGLDEGIQPVSVFDTLKAHNAEYIYFNTDHHWTALGAYYAYREFCKVKGVTPNELDSFETMEFPGFLGTFYSQSNESAALAGNPDTVVAYIPHGTNEMRITTHQGQTMDWKVITDVSSWNSSSYYSCFVGGDEQFAEIHNPEITDGSSIVVVKDSYADAYIPFLVDHYQDVYIVDFRYYPGTVADLVEEKGVDDVLYLISISNSSATGAVNNIAARVGGGADGQ